MWVSHTLNYKLDDSVSRYDSKLTDYGLVFGYQNTTQSSVFIQLCNTKSFQKALWFHFLM